MAIGRMSDEQFEHLVSEGMDAVPERFLRKLDNVAVVIALEPTVRQIRTMKLRRGTMLLGLYEGIPQTKRGSGYFGVLPDKITIFKNSILGVSRDEDDVRRIVCDTVWHEIAHHFGMEEGRVRKAENRRRI